MTIRPAPRPRTVRCAAVLPALALLASGARAQFDQQWVEFQANPAMLSPPGGLADATTEVRFAVGDLDNDGRLDVVVARRQPFTTTGKRTNVLLMNFQGVLTDQTAAFAAQSDVPFDLGFLTPTNDRDVAVTDVDQDGFADVVTAVALSAADPKHVGHPRVYRNLGSGALWNGLRHEDARMPQLFHYATGNPVNPNFCFVAAGDVDGDGDADLWFSDHDSSGAGGVAEAANADLNDRLLKNDGFGFFSDQSQASLTFAMLHSGYSVGGEIADVNGDGAPDVVKAFGIPTTGAGALPSVDQAVVYNTPASPGTFSFLQGGLGTNVTYAIATADLNSDGRLDLLLGEDFADRYRYNLGNDAMGRVVWGPPHVYTFLAGGDDGFVGRMHAADLDLDGFRDVLIADVDLDIQGFTRRLHLYHNPATVPGTQAILREERENPTSQAWVGAVGLVESDLRGTYDVTTLDVDGDGDPELLLGRSAGTTVWENRTIVCQDDLGFGGPGTAKLSMCGQELATGNQATLLLQGAPPNAVTALVASLQNTPTPFAGGLLVPVPIQLFVVTATDAQGSLVLPGVPGGNGPLSIFLQCVVVDPGQPFGHQLSNALRVDLLP